MYCPSSVRTPANWVPGGMVVVPPEYDDEAAKVTISHLLGSTAIH